MADRPDSLDRLRSVLRKLVQVPKSEVLRKEREYKAKRARQRARVAPSRKAG